MDTFDEWALSLAVFLPLVGMIGVMFAPKRAELAQKSIALGSAVASLVVGVIVVTRFDWSDSSTQLGASKQWIPLINARYDVGVDGIGLPLLLLSMFITVLVIIYSWDHFPEPHNTKGFLALMLLLEVGMNGTFVAQDLILFFIFFEIVLLPMFFMIGVWGGPNRKYASLKFFLFTLLDPH